ncbi:hypothetical protein DL346_26245 [Paenibacillus montanisoli]|uniref:Uncharacterized protein n=1 Tax=Paenibacillus montanisoli TaxID=2081970 RepID=A0A328TT95_9BACL|nr:hypothetical protein DL346_26245 [Paenibacillus montanisoli]
MTSFMPFDERGFGTNDIFLISCIIVVYGIMFLLPKRFPLPVTILLLCFSASIASILDNSISGHIFDLYDIMDGPQYSIMDFIVYPLYAPFGYFFIYAYDLFRLKGLRTVVYISLCSLLSVGFEWLCYKAGVFHYKNGYHLWYSYPIYLLSQTATVYFYKFITGQSQKMNSSPSVERDR